MIAIIDYGAGNIFSVKNALDYIGSASVLTSDKNVINSADRIILPGVGAFPDAMNKLKESGLDILLKEQAEQKPFLGICLGMQMLFDESEEFSDTCGLGLISGKVEKIETKFKLPHMGWNSLVKTKDSKLLQGINTDDTVYFVHSFKANTVDKNISAYCEYGTKIAGLVEKENVFGAQFHPEKSGEIGIKILKNFCNL